jgi:hypothetical protein
MNSRPSQDSQSDTASAEKLRKAWRKPVVAVLPMELTQHSASTGNDGSGGTSHS